VALAVAVSSPALAVEIPSKVLEAEPAERLAGLAIEQIEIEASPSENKTALLSLTGLSVGAPYVAADARRAVELLYQLGRFQNVYVSAARSGNGVFVRFDLPPRPRVRDVKITGDALSQSEIEDAIELHGGSELDTRTFREKRLKIAGRLERLGYRSPAIGIAAEPVDRDGNFDLLVRVDAGPRTRLRSIRIDGKPNRPLPALVLDLGIKRGDVLNLNDIDAALLRIASDYRKRGYLEIEIAPAVVHELNQSENSEPLADLIIHIDAGPLIKVVFRGNRNVPIHELQEAASILAERAGGVGTSQLKEVSTRIQARYERRGYWQVKISPLIRISSDRQKKAIIYQIDEGSGSYVASIRFPGGKYFSDQVLRQKVIDVVESALSEDGGSPGADAKTLGAIFGDASEPRGGAYAPDNSAPRVKNLFVARAYGAAVDAISDMYHAEGFQNAQIDQARVLPKEAFKKTSPGEDRGTMLVDVTINISEGVRWMIGALSFAGNESVTSSRLLELTSLDPGREGGEPLSFYKVDEASRAILTHYRNEGYLYARVSEDLREVPARGSVSGADFVHTSSVAPLDVHRLCERAVKEQRATCEVQLVFRVFEGPQVRTRQIVVRGARDTAESLIRQEIALKEGDVLKDSDILTTRTNLLRYGIFERVDVRPIDEDVVSPDKDVLIELRERKPWSAEVGAGIATEDGARVFGSITQANLFGTALRFQANAKVYYNPFVFLYSPQQIPIIETFYSTFKGIDRIQRALSAGLTYPQIYGMPRGFGAGLDASYIHHYEPVYGEDSINLSLNGNYKGFRPQVLGRQRPITFLMRVALEYSALTCNRDVLQTVKGSTVAGNICSAAARSTAVEGKNLYAIVGPTLRWDLTDDPLNPSSGAFFELLSEYAGGLVSNSPNFVRLEGKVNVFIPVVARVGFAFSARFGSIFQTSGTALTPVPANRRYYAGGASTIRGYPEQALFPHDNQPSLSTAITSGGLILATLKSEFRFPILGAISGALFYDIGDIWETIQGIQFPYEPGSPWRQGVGFGVRLNTPVGPLAIDLGVPLILRGDPGEKAAVIPVPHLSLRVF
jgi:outer membrane protein assembly factor BamA